MKMKQPELKIYLKNKIRPIVVIVNDRKDFEAFIAKVRNESIIIYGPIAFSRDEFRYAVLED